MINPQSFNLAVHVMRSNLPAVEWVELHYINGKVGVDGITTESKNKDLIVFYNLQNDLSDLVIPQSYYNPDKYILEVKDITLKSCIVNCYRGKDRELILSSPLIG